MKLSYFDCQFLAQKLKNIARNPDVGSHDKRYCDTLLPYFERIVESRPDGVRMSSDVEIAFEDKINERIAELVRQENKAQEKIDLMEKIRANMTKVFWDYFFLTIKVVLIFTLLGASLYTIAHLVPKEWAIWTPLPIAAGLAFWEWCGSIFKRWYHGHWK